ncbi:hypothetical protein BDZ91DRAFT_766470 [Kalaharituber pfeilii]|nr:hypothetical protein BDZ91DRAFT_766470 [Kalaharituber pfeilii]
MEQGREGDRGGLQASTEEPHGMESNKGPGVAAAAEQHRGWGGGSLVVASSPETGGGRRRADATNLRWRQERNLWSQGVAEWVRAPRTSALLHAKGTARATGRFISMAKTALLVKTMCRIPRLCRPAILCRVPYAFGPSLSRRYSGSTTSGSKPPTTAIRDKNTKQNRKQTKPKSATSHSQTTIDAAAQILGLDFGDFASAGITVDRMLAEAKGAIEIIGTDVLTNTKERIYSNIVEYIEVAGYPTETRPDFTEANVNDLVLCTITPILVNYRRATGSKIHLQREKRIISPDSETGDHEEFIMIDKISVMKRNCILVIESTRTSLREANKQCLLALKDMRDQNGGGVVYGFITIGTYWQMLKYDGTSFVRTEDIPFLFDSVDADQERWMKNYSVLVEYKAASAQGQHAFKRQLSDTEAKNIAASGSIPAARDDTPATTPPQSTDTNRPSRPTATRPPRPSAKPTETRSKMAKNHANTRGTEAEEKQSPVYDERDLQQEEQLVAAVPVRRSGVRNTRCWCDALEKMEWSYGELGRHGGCNQIRVYGTRISRVCRVRRRPNLAGMRGFGMGLTGFESRLTQLIAD